MKFAKHAIKCYLDPILLNRSRFGPNRDQKGVARGDSQTIFRC